VKISKALRENSTKKLGDKKRVYAISDHCDIRKEYSRELENLGKVRDLKGNIINGYSSLGTILLDEEKKDITLSNIAVFSNREERFVSQEELKKYNNNKLEDKDRVLKIKELIENDTHINNTISLTRQSKEVSDSLKTNNKEIVICHIHDRFGDNSEYFEHIDKILKDEFVIRIKASRNSNKKMLNAKGNEVGIKLISVEFSNKKEYIIERLKLKGKLYEHAKVLIEWDKIELNKKRYNTVRISLKTRDNKPIHKQPMLLITNIEVENYKDAKEIYHTYLLRSKIESVFKFLKDILGLEEFQVRDYNSIKNIIALCYFIGNYFYEIDSALIHNPTIEMLCEMGEGKGTVSRHFFLEGIKKLLIAQNVLRFKRDNDISNETWHEMALFAGVGEDECCFL
jgi:hypothetical protein